MTKKILEATGKLQALSLEMAHKDVEQCQASNHGSREGLSRTERMKSRCEI
jgi:hypothetical protein